MRLVRPRVGYVSVVGAPVPDARRPPRANRRRFLVRLVGLGAATGPVAFGFGYAAGGLSAGIGGAATSLALLATGAGLFAFRNLRGP